jgi:hypothetical protein
MQYSVPFSVTKLVYEASQTRRPLKPLSPPPMSRAHVSGAAMPRNRTAAPAPRPPPAETKPRSGLQLQPPPPPTRSHSVVFPRTTHPPTVTIHSIPLSPSQPASQPAASFVRSHLTTHHRPAPCMCDVSKIFQNSTTADYRAQPRRIASHRTSPGAEQSSARRG